MNIPSNSTLNRRAVIRGGGVCLSLPFLEAMATESQESSQKDGVTCKRIATISAPYGVVPDAFFPTTTGADYKMQRSMEPMTPVRDHFTCFSGFDHALQGGHLANHTFMSGIKHSDRSSFKDGNITIDQRVAELVGHHTRFPSLNFWAGGMSFTRSGVKVPSITKPSDAFHMMFVDDSEEALKVKHKTLSSSGSILDAIGENAKRFNAQLGKRDQEKMDEYFTSLRGTEKKIQASKNWLTKKKPVLDGKKKSKLLSGIAEGTYDVTVGGALLEAWFELMFLALQTDSTRVASMAFHQVTWEIPGVVQTYHGLSHHGKLPEKLEQLRIIDTFLMTHLSTFIQRLRDAKEGDGKSMLDSTLVLFGSGLGNGNHSNANLPVILAGGPFEHGSHLGNSQSVPLCNLYLNMLQQFDPEAKYFNVSSGTVPGLALA